MRVLQKVIKNSFIMILATTIVFIALYSTLLYASRLDTAEIKDSAIGSWSGVQYYLDGIKYVCSQGHPVNVTFTEETITIISEAFPSIDQLPCSFGKRSVQFNMEDEEIVASLYFDEGGYLHMVISVWKLDLALTQRDSD